MLILLRDLLYGRLLEVHTRNFTDDVSDAVAAD